MLSGIHAREWISPATALWTIHSVLGDEKMLNSLDWFIHPIVNPDGFTFTHEHVIIIIVSNIIIIIVCRHDCGGRPGLIITQYLDAEVLMLTGTMDITGMVRMIITN